MSFDSCIYSSLLSHRQQYGFDDTTASGSTATLLHRHELASTSLSDTRKTIGTRKVSFKGFPQRNEFGERISDIHNPFLFYHRNRNIEFFILRLLVVL